jgi:hypothetical protein
MNALFVLAVLGGAAAGFGLFLVVFALSPAGPALGPALARLHPTFRPAPVNPVRAAIRARIRAPHQDLAILDRTEDRYLLTLALSGLFGLLAPAFIGVVAILAGVPLPIAIPGGGAVLAAAASVWLAHRDIAAKAAHARAEFRRDMCTYLDLAAHQVLGGHGPMESLERAVAVCDGWVFTRLRDALLRAQLNLTPPWGELKALAVLVGVVELGDLADIMRTAGLEGAHVYETLRARADSLRDQIRTEALAAAEVRTNKLDIPAAALILVLLVLIGYPFMARLFIH